MKEHKYAKMIKAKADNKVLIVFRKTPCSDTWQQCRQDWWPVEEQDEYFLCHPKHADVCLHWLNAGEIEIFDEKYVDTKWVQVYISLNWNRCHPLMSDTLAFRIKPRKEKRWVVVKNGTLISNRLFVSKHEAEVVLGRRVSHDAQFIEIETEV